MQVSHFISLEIVPIYNPVAGTEHLLELENLIFRFEIPHIIL
jgi:hypothetical protein